MILLLIIGTIIVFFIIILSSINNKNTNINNLNEVKSDEQNDGWDPNYKTLYVNPAKKGKSNIWSGNELIESLKLKDGKEHKFELKTVHIDGTIFGHSLTTNRNRVITKELFDSLIWKGKTYNNLIDFSNQFRIASREMIKQLIYFDYINKEGINSSRSLDIDRVYCKFNVNYFRGFDSKKNEERTFNFDRMSNIKIQNENIDKDLTHIIQKLNAISPDDYTHLSQMIASPLDDA